MLATEDLGARLDIPGFRLGHASDREGKTGVTVILAEEGAAGTAEIRGSATGTRQFDSLVSPHHPAPGVHALVLAGGSAYGLSAADGVVVELARRRIGLGGRHGVIPLVPTAILFDLGFGDSRAHPDAELALRALEAAGTDEVSVGSVGVGVGATVGKIRGVDHAMKGGFGFSALRAESGFTVAAAVGVNAFGDVRDPDSGALLAGVRVSPDSRELADSRRLLAGLPPDVVHPWETNAASGNTTLVAILTDADLPKPLLLKVCQMAFGGLYRTLAPALTLYDGDLVATLTSRRVPAHPHAVGVLAEETVARAILRAVRNAEGFGIVPAVSDLPRSELR